MPALHWPSAHAHPGPVGPTLGATTLPFLLLLVAGCAGPARYRGVPYQAPIGSEDGWAVGSAADHGLDSGLLETMTQKLAEDHFVQLRSMVLVHEGELVLELYDRPSRARRGQDLRSTTKSLTGLLLTEAATRGLLDLDEPVASRLPVPATGFDPTTARHLLTMRSGLACDDHDRTSPGHEDTMYRRRDWLAFWIGLPQLEAPGQTGRYCTGNAVALGRVLESAVGQPADRWAHEVLFDPLGIHDARWAHYDRGRGVDTGGHLRLRPRDLAKIGQLVLDEGRWKGIQVLDPATIREATTPRVSLEGSDYGHLWWLSHFQTTDGRELRVWETRGNGGQHLFILPELDLVAAFTGGAYNHPDARLPYALMQRYVLPAAGVQAEAP